MVVAALVSLGSACSHDATKESTVKWDLRSPTTARQLGGTDMDATVRGPAGTQIDVDIQLPGNVVVRDTVTSVSATPADPSGAVADHPVGLLQLIATDSPSISALVAAVDNFDHRWHLTAEARTAWTTLLADLRSKLGDGAVSTKPWPTGPFAYGLDGAPIKGVKPRLTVRIRDGAFSTFTTLAWDPLTSSPG